MIRRSLFALALLLGLTLPFITAPAASYAVASDPTSATRAAIAWLEPKQLADGSFPGFSVGDKGFDPIFTFVAAGVDPHAIAQPGGQSLIAFAQQEVANYTKSGAAATAKAVLAAVAAGDDPRAFGGLDLVTTLQSTYNAVSNTYGTGGGFSQSLALLALGAADVTPPPAAVTYLLDLQAADGGWEYAPGFGTDTNTTALAIQALVEIGPSNAAAALTQARAYLRSTQNDDGGFPYAVDNASDANSTGYVLQAIAALGDSPTGSAWTRTGGDPITALLGLQNPSGAFRSPFTGTDDNILATLQAVPGLTGQRLPMHLTRISLPLLYSSTVAK